jgi:hypothetical protein
VSGTVDIARLTPVNVTELGDEVGLVTGATMGRIAQAVLTIFNL